ncbi:MAG: NAD-dependent epimerase/dehydratase family protein [Bacteroidetes bacterium]|nr:NAD-dependent epimerase/dehydratase family protein [Bacteroidota bacterium]
MKKVFVTGACGMLGNSVCRELLNKNYLVKALVLENENSKSLEDTGVEICRGNILNYNLLLEQLKGCEIVIHIAAITDLYPRRSEMIIKVNIEGTVNIIKAVKELKLERMIHIGSASSFGNGTKQNPGNEFVPYNSSEFKMDYLDSKFNAQQILINEFKENGFPVVIINPTFMIGEFDAKPSSGKLIVSVCNNQLKFYNDGGRNFVYSKDVAIAVVNAITMGKTGECYLAGNENLTYFEFFKKIFNVIGKNFNMRKVGKFTVLFVGFLSSVWARITKKKPVISMGIALLSLNENYYDPSKARRELLMPSTPIDTAIKNSIAWFKSNGYIN